MPELEKYTEANRKAWNAAMPHHRKARDDHWNRLLSDPDYVFQTDPELSILQEIGIRDKDIANLCCNNGLELLSLKRLGARRCVGFDISDEAISDARQRAERFHLPAEFHRHSVYDIPAGFDASFDLVYITIGALTWLPDLRAFFAIASRLLKPGGDLFIYESHPFAQVLPWDVSKEQGKPEIENDYFVSEALLCEGGLDYYGNADYDAPPTYEFVHTLSDILSAILANDLRLTRFLEYEHDISCGLAWIEQSGLRLPLSYILTASKAGTR